MSKQPKFSNVRVLIIDDMSEMRSSLKSMCELLGIERIDQATDGNNALDQLRKESYELILCDYDLGKGRDGQQVLEEARYAKLMKAGASFIMVTAAQTLELVMSVVEHQPDAYIAKPVTFEELKKRLVSVLRRKALFEDISRAIDMGHIDEALEHCDRLIIEKPKYAVMVYRIKGKLLYEDQRYEEAKELYQTVLEMRPVPWAEMGLARCYRDTGNLETAKRILKGLIRTNEHYVECHDTLAGIYKQERKLEEAQKVLEKAVSQSPKSPLRQSILAEIATKNEDWPIALKASRKAVALCNNSVHSSATNFLNLARCLQTQLSNEVGYREKTYAMTEIKKSIQIIKKEFGDKEENHVKAALIESLTSMNQGDLEKSEKQLTEARKMFDALPKPNAIACVWDVGQTYVDQGKVDEAEEFLGEMKAAGMLNEDSGYLLQKLKGDDADLTEDELVLAQKEEMDNLNNRGVELFESGQLKEATELFKQATTNPQAGHSTYLNTIQALILFMQKDGHNKEDAKFCLDLFSKLEDIGEKDKNYLKLKKLKKMYKSLTK